MLVKKLIAAVFIASVFAAPASAAELIINGGFEDAFASGWSHSYSATLDVIGGSTAHSGSLGARYTASDAVDGDVLVQAFSTVVGQTYVYSYWLAAATTDSAAPSEFMVMIGSQIVADLFNTWTFEYTRFTGSYLADSDVSAISFFGFNSLGVYSLDDVSVKPRVETDTGGGVPEPASWALMVLGFGGLGAVLRRRRGQVGLAA
jgi:hypothetical protein